MKKVTCLLSILFIIICLVAGCKKQQAPPIKPSAAKVQPVEINLLAIAWDKQKYYALIMFPDRKSYTITEGTKLGVHGGKVEKITQDTVLIREYIKDYRGVVQPKDSILKLRKEEGG